MSDDEFDDEPDIDDEDLDDDLIDDDVADVDDVLDDDDALIDDDDAVAAIPDDPAAIVEVPVATPIVEESDDEDDDVVDLDEELHPDDVEEALDVVLRERTAAAGLGGAVDANSNAVVAQHEAALNHALLSQARRRSRGRRHPEHLAASLPPCQRQRARFKFI